MYNVARGNLADVGNTWVRCLKNIMNGLSVNQVGYEDSPKAKDVLPSFAKRKVLRPPIFLHPEPKEPGSLRMNHLPILAKSVWFKSKVRINSFSLEMLKSTSTPIILNI